MKVSPLVAVAAALVLADARIDRMVWRGWVKLDVTSVIDNQERLEERIREAVRRIFERYPTGGR